MFVSSDVTGLKLSGFGLGRAFLHRALGLLSGFFKSTFAPFLTFTKLACQKITFLAIFWQNFEIFILFLKKKTFFTFSNLAWEKITYDFTAVFWPNFGRLYWFFPEIKAPKKSRAYGLFGSGFWRARQALRARPEARNITICQATFSVLSSLQPIEWAVHCAVPPFSSQ